MKKVILTLSILLAVSGQASAVIKYWDTNVDAGVGGTGTTTPTGTWDTGTTSNWNTVAAGTGGVTTWTAGDSAVFSAGGDATGSYTVTVSGTQSLVGLTAEEGLVITQSGGTLDFGATANAPISIATGTTWTQSATSVLAGTAALTKSGGGVLNLRNTNTFSSAAGAQLTISAGIVDFTTDAQLGAVPGAARAAAVTINGGTLRFSGSSAATLNALRGVTIGASGGTIEVVNTSNTGLSLPSAATYTLNGSGTLTKTGAGRFTMNTTSNSFTGKYIVNQGSISTPGDGRYGLIPVSPTADYFTLNGGGLRHGLTSSTTLNANRGITLGANGGFLAMPGGASGVWTYGGIIAGTSGGSFTARSDDNGVGGLFPGGTVLLSGVNTYDGPTIVNPNTTLSVGLLAPGGTDSNIGKSSSAASNLQLNGGSLKYTGAAVSTDRGYTVTSSGGTLDGSGTGAVTISGNMVASAVTGTQTLTLAGSATGNELSGTINNGGGTNVTAVTMNGAGSWILSNANNYTGNTTITAGTLAAGNNAAFSTSTVTLNGGALATSGGARTLGNTVNLAVNSSVTPTNNLTLNGTFTAISGANRVLTGTTNTGTTTLGGPVFLSDAAGTAGTLIFAGGTTSNPVFTVSGTIANFNGSGLAGNIQVGNGSTATAATLNLTGTNTHTGNTSLSTAALVNIGSAGALGASTLNILGNGSFDNTTGGALILSTNMNQSGGSPTFVGTDNLTLGNVAIAGANRTITVSAKTLTINNTTQDLGARIYTKDGAGKLVIKGAGGHLGGTRVSNGTLQLGDGGTTGSLSTTGALTFFIGTGTGTGNVTFNRSNNVTQGVDFGAAAITESNVVGSLTQAGGSLSVATLTAANTYTGGTTVNSGTLLANNTTGSGTGTGGVTVNNTGTFGGTGAVSGAVTVNDGGTLSPGASVESLGTGSLTFNASATVASTLKYEIGPAGTADLVNAALGSLTIANPTSTFGAVLSVTSAGFVPNGDKYTVIAYNGTWDGNSFKNAPNNGYLYLGGAYPKQFLVKYQDTTPGGNFYSTETQPGSPNITAATRFVTLTAVPEFGSFLTMGLVGFCALGAVRLGKRYGFKALSL